MIRSSLLFVFFFFSLVLSCDHPGGPLKEAILDGYVKDLIGILLPLSVPDLNLSIGSFNLKVTDNTVKAATFVSSKLSIAQKNTIVFEINGLAAQFSLNFAMNAGNVSLSGSAQVTLKDSNLSTTTLLTDNAFNNTDSTFKVGDLTLQASNQKDIEPYWDFIKPILIDTLEQEVPNIIKELNTGELRALVLPLIAAIEPVSLPPINKTILGIYGGFSNLELSNIGFDVATIEKGSQDNEVKFALSGVTGHITNNWEFKGFGLDQKGTGHIDLSDTGITISVALGQKDDQFTVNLDSSSIHIGHLEVAIDGGSGTIINWLIKELQPVVITVLTDTFSSVLCLIFDAL